MLHHLWNDIVYFYGYMVFFYSLALIVVYSSLVVMAYRYSSKYKRWTDNYIRHMVDSTPYVPGVSIVAPAFNESKTIIDNVNSLLQLKYPNFEVCIVNDGSKDDTLEKLIENFDMVQVPFEYVEHIHCKPFKGLYRSVNEKYKRLLVVDKVNGGTKADAVNAGLNVIKNPYFINTDVDCVLSRDAIYHCIFPVLQDSSIIAVSGTMSLSNGSTIDDDGQLVEIAPSSRPVPLIQDLEYKRSFLIGKMGWSMINAMNNVSGGYGLFDTQVVIAAGGYGFDSFAEDMDMLTRMIAYCRDFHREYRVVQIPHTCCWTEGPDNIKMLHRQRIRWGRGLIQLMWQHRRILFNPHYGRLGLITFPNTFFFEFLAPIIEALGTITMVILFFTNAINGQTFFLMFAAIYIFSLTLSSFVIFYDYILGSSYTHIRSYLKLMLAAIIEPILYHPLVVIFSLQGYWKFLINETAVWTSMERKGMKKK